MNSRERFITTITGGIPDRPPIFATLTPQVGEYLAKYFNLPYEEPVDSLLSTRISHTEVLLKAGNDCVGIAAQAPTNQPTIENEEGIMINDWGMRFKNAGLYNEFYEFPLDKAETVDDILNFNFPDPHASGRYIHAKEQVSKYKGKYGVIADLETSIFETAWYLTGLEKFLMDLMMQTPYVDALLDKIVHINTEIGKELIRIGADMIWCGDDFGTQTGLIMDPGTWRHYFKPRIKYMFEEFRKVNPDIKIAWHSCGAISELIPDFIEVGLDVINPLQPLATGMEPETIKAKFEGQVKFFGGICVQDLLPNGTPEKIKAEVKRRAQIFGEKGGYILAPAHNIQPDTPVGNILAMYEALRELE